MYIGGGTVTFSSCSITGNTATIVRAHAQSSHRPHGRLMFCSFLQGGGVYVYSGTVTMMSCSITGNTASGSVRAHVETSHRPHGIFTCFVLAGRRCVHRRWHGELLIVLHHWQHSFLCACSRSKVPIAPMGRWLTCPNRLSSIRNLYVPATPANFPSPRWEKC